MPDLDISQVARQTGVPASTLRYYEERGLIKAVGRRGLKRFFDPNVIERLAMIALGQAAGFSLDEIAAMFGDADQPRIDRRRCVTGYAMRRTARTPAIWTARNSSAS